ncbi:MAG: DUF4230 domain-containing protein [Succinivibrio sp.]|nr:DUF4230 domain-containing protein [Succinivibrio sp.]
MLKKIIACAAGLFIIAAAYGIFANNIDDETTVNGEHLGTQHVEVSDEITINTKTLKDYVSKTEKLITCEYYYSEIGDYEKSKPFLNFKLPFTTDKTLYTYSGKISAGINLKDLDFDVNASRKTITVKYPPVQILAHDMDQGFEFYDIKKAVFNRSDFNDFEEFRVTMKKQVEEKLMARDDFIKDAQDNAETIMEGLLTASGQIGDYTIKHQW